MGRWTFSFHWHGRGELLLFYTWNDDECEGEAPLGVRGEGNVG